MNNDLVSRDPATPFTREWFAGGIYNVRITKPMHVMQPSVFVAAMSAPALDDTTTAEETALAENEWARIKYIDFVLEQMMIHQLGLVESGAETPWEEASALVKKYLMPDVMEAETNAWIGATYRVFGEARFGIRPCVSGSDARPVLALIRP